MTFHEPIFILASWAKDFTGFKKAGMAINLSRWKTKRKTRN